MNQPTHPEGGAVRLLPPGSSRPRRWRQYHASVSALFLSPVIVIIGLFTLVPMVMTVVISFHKWSMFTPITRMKPVGFDNYARLFEDGSRLQALANTGAYVGLSVLVTLPLALLIALLLFFPKLKGRNLLRTLLFSTYVIPTIAIVIIFSNLYAPNYGPFATLATSLGLPAPTFLSSPNSALLSLVAFNIWQMLGYYVILLVAGLTQIPQELFEAAQLDGAGALRQTAFITVPLLRHSLVFVALMTVINSVQVFDPIYLLTQGGPAGSTNVISFQIQRSAFQNGLAGDASALAVSLFLLLVFVGGLLSLALRGRNQQ